MITPLQFAAKHGITRSRVYELLDADRIVGAEYFKPRTRRAKTKRGFWGIPCIAIIVEPRKPWEKKAHSPPPATPAGDAAKR